MRRRLVTVALFLAVFLVALGLVGCLAAALLGLQALGDGRAWLDVWVLGPVAVAALALGGFAARERVAAEPLIVRTLFADRSLVAANTGGFLGFAALTSASVFVPLFVRGVLGGTARQAGMALMPMSLAWVAGSNAAGRLLVCRSPRLAVVPGSLLVLSGCLGLCSLSDAAGRTHLLLSVSLLGAGMGLAMTGFLVAVQEAAPPLRLGVATSSVQSFKSLGGAVGVSLLGAVFIGGLHSAGIDSSGLRGLADEGGRSAPEASSGALMAALRPVFLVGLLMAGGGVAASLSMPGGRRERASQD